MQLTARDWHDLGAAAIVLIVCAAVDSLLVLYARRTKNESLLRISLLDPWVVPFVIWLLALAPILERRGLPKWLSVIVLVTTLLVGLPPILRKARRDWKAGAALHRAENAFSGETSKVSNDANRLRLYVNLAYSAAIAAIVPAPILVIMTWAGQPVGTGVLATAIAVMALTFIAEAYVRRGRWPGEISRSASIDIAAAPDRVWDALVLRDDYPGWKKIYTGIERLDEPGELYRLRYAEQSHCAQCLLPRRPDRSLSSARVEVLEAHRPSLYRLRSVMEIVEPNKGDLVQLSDYEESAWRLQPLAGGQTRLTYEGVIVRPKVWLAITSILGGAPKPALRSLKAHLEGAPDETVYGIAAKRIEAARNAPQHCACAA